MSTPLEAALLKLEGMLDRRGWHADRPYARLWYLRSEPGARYRAMPVPGPHNWDKVGNPVTLYLREFARKMYAERVHKRLPPSMAGWAFNMEAWGIHEDLDAPAHVKDQMEEARKRREYHKFPGSYESRMVAGALLTGELAMCERERGKNVGFMLTQDSELPPELAAKIPEGGSVAPGGIVIDALRLLCGFPEADTWIEEAMTP